MLPFSWVGALMAQPLNDVENCPVDNFPKKIKSGEKGPWRKKSEGGAMGACRTFSGTITVRVPEWVLNVFLGREDPPLP